MEKCLFCQIIKGRVKSYKVYEDHASLVFLDINPIAPGHLLVIPKIHTSDILDMSEEDYAALFKLVKFVSVRLRKAVESKRIGIAVEGFSIPHVHIHLVPVNKMNELDPNKSAACTESELLEMQKKIARAI